MSYSGAHRSPDGDSYGSPILSPTESTHSFHIETPPRPSFSSRLPFRRGSTASSVSSIGGILDSSSQYQARPAAESEQNAISTLLQPPIVRTGLLPHTAATAASAQRPPSTKDIPPVTLTNIPHVEPATFRPYLTQIGTLYDSFQQAKANSEENGGFQFYRREKDSTEDFSELLERNLRRSSQQYDPSSISRKASTTSLTVSPLLSPQLRRPSSSGGIKRSGHGISPLSTVPKVYFEEDFRLENPRTFDIVSERSDVVRENPITPTDDTKGANGFFPPSAPTGRKALATNAILQEKLSWYLDTVEVHLISSISNASTSFFAALGSLRELHSEAQESVAKIKALREELEKLDRDMAVGGLNVLGLRRRRNNVQKLALAIEQLKDVVERVAECNEMVERGDIERAMDAIEGIERLISGQGPQRGPTEDDELSEPPVKPFNLRGIKALSGAQDELKYLRHRVGKGFEARFLETLLGDLRRHIQSVSSTETLERWASSSPRYRADHGRKRPALPTYLKLDDSVRSELLSILNGLSRARHTAPATSAYRDAILREMKNLIRQHLPSSTDDDAESMVSVSTHSGRHLSQQEKSTILARNLRALDPESAEDLFTKIYSGVGEGLRRLGVQVKVLLDVTSSITQNPEGSSPVASMNGYFNGDANANPGSPSVHQEITQALDLSSLLGQAVDIAQTQITKVLKVRADQSIHLPLQHFLRYFHINRLFADECEAVSGRGGTALKNAVNGHIKDFVANMGEAERQMLAQSMESDRWDAKDFGEAENSLLQNVLGGSTRDIDAWMQGGRIWESLTDSMQPMASKSNNSATENGKDKVRSATFDEQKYILPASAAVVLQGVERFENLIAGIPSMTHEVSTNLLEYLKVFNSRSCQLILGAGATRSAGLKNITTKHLALASQSLSFIIGLIPYIREFVRRHSPPSSVLMAEFDKVKRLYQEHQSGIHDKLVEIMSMRSSSHVTAMKKIDWDSIATTQQEGASLYMETLTKETTTLHRVLSRHFPESTLVMIMDPVFTSYREQWGNAFRAATVKTDAGKERLLRDAELFQARLSKITSAGDIGDMIVNIVKDKKPIQSKSSSNPGGSATSPAAPNTGSNASSSAVASSTNPDTNTANTPSSTAPTSSADQATRPSQDTHDQNNKDTTDNKDSLAPPTSSAADSSRQSSTDETRQSTSASAGTSTSTPAEHSGSEMEPSKESTSGENGQ